MFPKDSAEALSDSLVAALSSSIKPTVFSTILVMFVKQTEELGEASPKEAVIKPAENP